MRPKMAVAALAMVAAALAGLIVRRGSSPDANTGDGTSTLVPSPDFLEDWPLVLPAGVRFGSAAAPVQIVQFVDLQCPACALQHEVLRSWLPRQDTNVIAVVDIPLPLSIHPFADAAARRAECARRLGRYHDYVHAVYSNPDALMARDWSLLSTLSKVPDHESLEACAESEHSRSAVDHGRSVAHSVGVRATPTLIINGWMYRGVLQEAELDAIAGAIRAGLTPPNVGGLLARAMPSVDRDPSAPLRVHYTSLTFSAAPRVELEERPVGVAGAIGDPAEYDLSLAHDPLLLADGRMVFGSSFSPMRLMLFSAAGQPMRQLVRMGRGPGEVAAFRRVVRARGDTLLLADDLTRRLVWLSADDGVVRERTLSSSMSFGAFGAAGELSGGHVALHTPTGALRRNDATGSGSTTRDRAAVDVMILGPDSTARRLPAVPGLETAIIEAGGAMEASRRRDFVRLSSHAVVATWDTLLVVGNTATFSLSLHDRDGRQVAVVSAERPRRPVTDEMIRVERAREVDRQRAVQREPRRASAPTLEQLSEMAVFADSLPTIEAVHVAPNHVLWVVDAVAPTDTSWSAIGLRLDGSIIARIEAPLRLGLPATFGNDRVLLQREDRDGFRSFAAHRFRPSRVTPAR